MVTVRQHTAKYDAADKMKEALKKKGAGDELEERKKKLAMEQLAGEKASEELEKKLLEKEKEEKKSTKDSSKVTTEPAFTAAEYKSWYHWDQDADPNNKAAKKVAKALRAQMGRAGYNRYFNELTEGYSPRGHISAYKKVGSLGGEESSIPKKNKSKKSETSTPEAPAIPKSESALKKAGWTYVRTNKGKVGGGSIGYWVSPDRETMISGKSSYRPGSGKSVSIEADKPKKPTKSVLALLDRDSRASTTSAKT